jgi:hypothetical protein
LRRHAKASAESTKRRAASLGRFFRASAARRLLLPLSVFAAILAAMALIAASAGATKTHLFKEVFGSAAQPSFGLPQGIAVDQPTGDVLILESRGTPSIKRYHADGTPANFPALGTNVIDGTGAGDETPQNGLVFGPGYESQIAVDNSGGATDGDIYVTQRSPNVINIFASTGAYLGQLSAAGVTGFSQACGVAVDSSGAVYVGDSSAGIHKFVAAANPPVNADNTATFTTATEPCALAAGAGSTAGFLFAAQPFGPISKLDSSSGALEYTVSSDSNRTVTLDPATGHVYAVTTNVDGRANLIKEFDASGVGSATQVSSFTAGTGPPVQGVAVRGSTGDVYVSLLEGTDPVEVFGPLVTVPAPVTGSASNIEPTSATLNGTVDPDGIELSECKFEFGTSTSYGQSVPCAESNAAIGAGTGPVPVHADISGLTLGATYHFRLVARNPGGTVNGADEAFKLQSPPVISEEWAQDVVRTEATLKAKINPEGFATTYRFEYGTTAAYGNSTTLSGVGSDKAEHIVSVFLEGLLPGTTYHYRAVATNSIGTAEGPDHTFATYAPFSPDTSCPNQVFRTGPAAALPDCRGYEMVSPLDKNGGDISTGSSVGGATRTAYTQSSSDGEKITYSALTSFGDQPSAKYSNQYIASRGSGGWSTHGINAPQSVTIFDPIFSPFVEFTPYYQAFTDDLSSGWVKDYDKQPLSPEGQANYMNFYRRDNTNGSFEALTVNEPSVAFNNIFGEVTESAEMQGISRDGSHAVFAARAAMTPDAAPGTNRQVYDYSGGKLHLVSVLPGGEAASDESNIGLYQADSLFGLWFSSAFHNAVSADGSRIFWSSGHTGGNNPPGIKIYVRIDGERTVPVSSGNAQWWTATSDGSKALFSEGGFLDGHATLDEFDVDSETTTEVAGGVYGVAGASEDLSHIYFASSEVLDAGATAGQPNLYLRHGNTTSFIATLANYDGATQGDLGVVNPEPGHHASRVTPDGRHIAFQSTASLTGYDNADANNGKASTEVYVYDADSDQLTCASCNPSGARPVGKPLPAAFTVDNEPTKQWAAAWLTTEEANLYSSNPLSDDGNHLFFNSFDALVPEDGNSAQDVYEWEAQGTGGCEKAAGCISLISTGLSPEKSEFLDADPSGKNVFFETESSIDPEDPGLIDIYDAREGGGFPYVAPSVPCVGDACQNVPAPPNDATPSSASFRGAGNPKPAKARKCRARKRKAAKSSSQRAKPKAAKRCRRAKRGAGR